MPTTRGRPAGVPAQQARAQGVERRDGQPAPAPFAEHDGHALTHSAAALFVKVRARICHAGCRTRRVGDAPVMTGSSPSPGGEDQKRAFGVQHRGTLASVRPSKAGIARNQAWGRGHCASVGGRAWIEGTRKMAGLTLCTQQASEKPARTSVRIWCAELVARFSLQSWIKIRCA